jgi:hypothetical protein
MRPLGPHRRLLSVARISQRAIPPRPLQSSAGESATQPDAHPRHDEDDDDGGQDDKAVRGHLAAVRAVGARVEEGIRVEALGGVRQVREAQVQRQHEDEECQVEQRVWRRGGQEELEQGVEADEAVLGYLSTQSATFLSRLGRTRAGVRKDSGELHSTTPQTTS